MPDRAAIVTAASSGVGLTMAHPLGEEGHAPSASSRRPQELVFEQTGLEIGPSR
jgi:NAD(P)-dependent dehydrogenase (short-subunit alcohol dehydrogenase family)